MSARLASGPRFHPRSAPVTFWYLVASVVLGVVVFFTNGSQSPLLAALVFQPADITHQPWTLLTDALLNYVGPFWFLLLGYVIWWVGSDLERWWGWRVQVGFLVAVAVASNGLMTLAHLVMPGYGFIPSAIGSRTLLCALFTVWALRAPDRGILLIFVPVSAAVVMYLEIAMTWYSYGPYYGLFAVVGSAGLGALYYHYGHRLHQFFRNLRKPKGPRPVEGDGETDRRFKRIMDSSGLHLVDDDE